jgi:two-component system CheB/CheR fusion protein
MTRSTSSFLIVGLGASAGGISALEEFFRAIPANCGMAFVVVTHLNPSRESHLPEVVSRYTALPVRIAEDNMKIEVDGVYVMPPARRMTIQNGTLRLVATEDGKRDHKPIDLFLASLAEDQGTSAVGVIMSGGDGDGALGVKVINERGGLTFAQTSDGQGPLNPQMPESAMATGIIDFALPASQIGTRLLRIARDRDAPEQALLRAEQDDQARKDMHRVAALIRERTGHDLSGYKPKTFLRRLLRRMTVTHCATIDAYVAHVSAEPEEIDALFRDLLISVTDFFRDADAFRSLETQVIPKLIETAGPDGTIRVWVPGCSTGEEAYSIAMLIHEQLDQQRISPRIQIFATDINEGSLGIARSARYPEALLSAVSPERRQKFFKRDGEAFVVAKAIREMCVFSPHSLISDPPFSRMDLVSCRNLLIYFGADLQRRVLPTFHYALRPGGYLLLGLSENIGQHSDKFVALNKTHRLFQRRETGTAHPGVPLRQLSIRHGIVPSNAPLGIAQVSQRSLRQAIEAQVLERYAPAHVVINAEEEVIYFSARTGPFLEQPRGAPHRQLLGLTRPELRVDVRIALRAAMTTRKRARRHALIPEEGTHRRVIIDVEPIEMDEGGAPNYLIVFGSDLADPPTPDDAIVRENDGTLVERLERTIQEMAEKLQSTVEEYETAAEELKSANEEMLSVNEELQSTNEELEASKEEMQSLNEELNTINAELTVKLDEVDRANADLRNIYESTQIASVFLDADLVIRQFTPAAHRVFSIRPGDIGRPLTELASVGNYPDLEKHIAAVHEGGETIEQQIEHAADGTKYLVRLIPYRGDDKQIDGVVVTFFDITQLVRAQAQQEVLIAELNHRVKNMLTVVIGIARQTLSGQSGEPDAADRLLGRLRAMARVYSLLSAEHWTEISFNELIGQEMVAFGSNRIRVSGDAVRLSPDKALPMSMVLHELATNAAKYGALSNETGHVDVSWHMTDNRLTLLWEEIGGPRVNEGEPSGFGLVLLAGQVEHQLNGTLQMSFEPRGVTVRVEVPFT